MSEAAGGRAWGQVPWFTLVSGVALVGIALLIGTGGERAALGLLLIVVAAGLGAWSARLPTGAGRAVAAFILVMVGLVVVRVVSEDAGLAGAWFCAGLGGLGVGTALKRLR